MDFFNKLGRKVSATCDATAEKTSRFAKEAKLRMKMNENKSDIKELYKEIGRKVYEKHVREENIDIKTELEEECTKIDVLSSEIESCLKTILELKERKQCPKCHSEIDLDAAFCSRCGEKQSEVEVKDADDIIEELEEVEIKPENEAEKEIVIEEVSKEDATKIDEEEIEAEKTENTIEKVTEIMSQETQKASKKEG